MRQGRRAGFRSAVLPLAAWVLFAPAAWATAPPSPAASRPSAIVPIADFESDVPEGTHSGNVQVKIVVDPALAASGQGCLQIRLLNASEDAYIVFPLPDQATVDPRSKLVAWVRRADSGKPVRLHWFALDGENWVIFQRRFQIDGGQGWTRVEWPLSGWRWGNERTGDWAEVRAIALRVESEVSELFLDELLLAGLSPAERLAEQTLRALAFPDASGEANARRRVRVAADGGLLVATDVEELLPGGDVKGLLGQMKNIRAWTRRTFADAVRPLTDGPPASLLVFRDREGYLGFFQRLGRQWNVEIVPPKTGGYTVQDLSACVHEPLRAGGLPVALHEGTHAVVSHELRLLPGSPAHAWLQEGLANYLQLCLYPQCLRGGEYAANFGKPIGPRTFFRPLEEILGKPVASRHYAQLASLVAWMIEERSDWLRAIAKGLADGRPLQDILNDLGTDLPEMEKLWLAWGKRTYVDPVSAGVPDTGRHFPVPPEWAGAAGT